MQYFTIRACEGTLFRSCEIAGGRAQEQRLQQIFGKVAHDRSAKAVAA
jgi:hypothetical protein